MNPRQFSRSAPSTKGSCMTSPLGGAPLALLAERVCSIHKGSSMTFPLVASRFPQDKSLGVTPQIQANKSQNTELTNRPVPGGYFGRPAQHLRWPDCTLSPLERHKHVPADRSVTQAIAIPHTSPKQGCGSIA